MEKPELEIVLLNVNDVITASGGMTGGGNNNSDNFGETEIIRVLTNRRWENG